MYCVCLLDIVCSVPEDTVNYLIYIKYVACLYKSYIFIYLYLSCIYLYPIGSVSLWKTLANTDLYDKEKDSYCQKTDDKEQGFWEVLH